VKKGAASGRDHKERRLSFDGSDERHIGGTIPGDVAMYVVGEW